MKYKIYNFLNNIQEKLVRTKKKYVNPTMLIKTFHIDYEHSIKQSLHLKDTKLLH